ncbi:MAG: NAD(P)-dependent oxidoreductase, partial [Ectothiorhodospiraceae bacterium]|nr:NAD(P)-dependent oxidoreductase [Ectothiorhodospiraceae bacterium]
RWSSSSLFCLLDHPIRELAGKRLGIVGYGDIGRGVAQVAEAFGMQVLVAQSLSGASHGQGRLPLDRLLAEADVVSLHCPLTERTRGLIDAAALARMKSDALIINTARGAIVDAPALADALRRGIVGGAGIDVLETEPPPPDHPLLAPDIPNLIVTPHIAWASRESRQRLVDELALNIEAFARGESRNRVA